jgi:ADP-heptose:LPS heptosyltransferase
LEVFAKVARQLINMGFQVVLTGKKEEAIYTQQVFRLIGVDAVDLTGKTSLGCLAQLIKNSKIVVCNDTGINHLADATKTKSAALFMQNSPSRWSPQDETLHRAIDIRGIDINRFPVQETAQKVLAEVKSLLGEL